MAFGASRIRRRVMEIERRRRIEEHVREVRAVVASGVCPECGAGLRRNLALAGWWQCAQFGADGFRADSSRPSCSWQGFTE